MKRAQVTIFVIVGLVILLLLLLFLLRRKTDIDPGIADTESAGAIKGMVAGCVEDALERLLRRAGGNGGHLDVSHLRQSGNAWEADLVSFPPQKVPYWTHLRPCPGSVLGCEASAQPSLCKMGSGCPLGSYGEKSLQEQLELALPEEILDCLADFSSVSELYEIELKGDPEAEVIFTGDGVLATVDMPLSITDLATGLSYRLNDFSGVADLNLGRVYSLANDIANAERNTSFLEDLTLHLISLYSGVDSPLPPMRAVSVLGQKRFWSRTQVERILQDEVLPWTNFVQVPNALASFRPILPVEEGLTHEEELMYAGIFFFLNKKVNDELYDDIGVRFFYPGNRPYLSINDGKEVLQPRSADVGGFLQKIVGMFMNDYRFRYTLSYPVIVTITDESAFGGEGYDWSFAMEANIWRNKAVNRTGTTSSFILSTERVDMTSPHQRVQNTIKIKSVDKEQLQRGLLVPVPNVQINYECGQSYFIGTTNHNGELTTRLPFCQYGGVIRFNKDGYLGSGIEYDNFLEDVENEFTLDLWPLKNVTLSMRKRNHDQVHELRTSVPNYYTIINVSSSLNVSDMAIFNIERVKETPYDEDLPMVGFYTFSTVEQNFTPEIEAQREHLERLREQGVLTDQDIQDWLEALEEQENSTLTPAQPSVSVMMAPGEYVIDGFILHNDKITIPEETRDFCERPIPIGGICLSTKEYTLNETNFTTWMKGGISFKDDEPYEMTWTALYNTDQLTFYMLEQKIPSEWQDLEEHESVDEFLDNFGLRLLQGPTFS